MPAEAASDRRGRGGTLDTPADQRHRTHHQAFDQGRRGTTADLVVTETRGQYGPLRSADKPKHVPVTRREAVMVHGYPALLDHDPVNHFLEVTWREPGGIELTVGLPRFDGQGWWLGQATCVRTSWSVVSNSSGVR